MAISEIVIAGTIVFTQQWKGDNMLAQAIIIEPYGDEITLTQEGRYIHLNWEELKDFIKALKSIKRP